MQYFLSDPNGDERSHHWVRRELPSAYELFQLYHLIHGHLLQIQEQTLFRLFSTNVIDHRR